ncbi:MAG: hypothetical protein JWR61_5201 [Ferruginibacter sp.]|nr:hypothetical protein [Ferruginibacter sp.]
MFCAALYPLFSFVNKPAYHRILMNVKYDFCKHCPVYYFNWLVMLLPECYVRWYAKYLLALFVVWHKHGLLTIPLLPSLRQCKSPLIWKSALGPNGGYENRLPRCTLFICHFYVVLFMVKCFYRLRLRFQGLAQLGTAQRYYTHYGRRETKLKKGNRRTQFISFHLIKPILC